MYMPPEEVCTAIPSGGGPPQKVESAMVDPAIFCLNKSNKVLVEDVPVIKFSW